MNPLHPSTALIIAWVVSIIIPFLSALLSRAHWNQLWTGVITLALSTANGFFTEWQHAGDAFRWQPAALVALQSFLIAVLAHKAILSNTSTETRLLAVGSKPKG